MVWCNLVVAIPLVHQAAFQLGHLPLLYLVTVNRTRTGAPHRKLPTTEPLEPLVWWANMAIPLPVVAVCGGGSCSVTFPLLDVNAFPMPPAAAFPPAPSLATHYRPPIPATPTHPPLQHADAAPPPVPAAFRPCHFS